jgi:hypothetical protein
MCLICEKIPKFEVFALDLGEGIVQNYVFIMLLTDWVDTYNSVALQSGAQDAITVSSESVDVTGIAVKK